MSHARPGAMCRARHGGHVVGIAAARHVPLLRCRCNHSRQVKTASDRQLLQACGHPWLQCLRMQHRACSSYSVCVSLQAARRDSTTSRSRSRQAPRACPRTNLRCARSFASGTRTVPPCWPAHTTRTVMSTKVRQPRGLDWRPWTAPDALNWRH